MYSRCTELNLSVKLCIRDRQNPNEGYTADLCYRNRQSRNFANQLCKRNRQEHGKTYVTASRPGFEMRSHVREGKSEKITSVLLVRQTQRQHSFNTRRMRIAFHRLSPPSFTAFCYWNLFLTTKLSCLRLSLLQSCSHFRHLIDVSFSQTLAYRSGAKRGRRRRVVARLCSARSLRLRRRSSDTRRCPVNKRYQECVLASFVLRSIAVRRLVVASQ